MIQAHSARTILRKASSGALLEEIRAWDSGKRDPEEISRYWCSLLHAENSCKRIIAAYEAAQGGKTGL